MAIRLTRQQLYDLVWAKPMTKVAEEFGVSDVMLARICTQRDVPRPPRGYWVNLSSTKKRRKYTKPPLPDLASGVSDFNQLVMGEYELREEARTDRFNWEELEEPVPRPPKEPEESQQEVVARLAEKLPEILEPGGHKSLHSIAQRIYDRDCQKARLKEHSIFDRPEYQDKAGKRLMDAYNGALWAFHRLWFKPTVTGRKHLRTHITFTDRHKSFVFFPSERGEKRNKQGQENIAPPQICFAWESEQWDARRKRDLWSYDQFSAADIKDLVLGLLAEKEKSYREYVIRDYEWAVTCREDQIKETEKKRLRALKLKQANVKARTHKRLELLKDADKRIQEADRIRALVTIFSAKVDRAGQEVPGFGKWSRWALQYADDLDPRHMSMKHFASWIGKFSLS